MRSIRNANRRDPAARFRSANRSSLTGFPELGLPRSSLSLENPLLPGAYPGRPGLVSLGLFDRVLEESLVPCEAAAAYVFQLGFGAAQPGQQRLTGGGSFIDSPFSFQLHTAREVDELAFPRGPRADPRSHRKIFELALQFRPLGRLPSPSLCSPGGGRSEFVQVQIDE